MARLGTDDFVEFKILGYQFPNHDHRGEMADDYDANWLNVEMHARLDNEEWTGTCASLLTHEAICLAEWLLKIADKKKVSRGINFIENALDITRHRNKISIELGWKFEHPTKGVVEIEFKPSREELRTFAMSLLQQLAKYPPRGVSDYFRANSKETLGILIKEIFKETI